MKPNKILELEKELGVSIYDASNDDGFSENGNYFKVDEDYEIINLSIKNLILNDIEFITNFNSLERLTIYSCQVYDISPLKSLINLISLNLNINKIKDISSIKNLKKIREVRLWSNQIEDISVLEELEEIEILDLWSNQVLDISSLKKLNKLRILDLGKNRINDITSLKNLINLKSLTINSNIIDNFSVLNELTQLTDLKLSSCNIVDVDFLENLVNLEFLYLSYNGITDITFLKSLKKIRFLDLSNNSIKNYDVLKELNSLTNLDLSSNHIANTNFFQFLDKVKILKLKDCSISDYSFFENLKEVYELDLSYNSLDDISFLRGMTHLSKLNLKKNLIENCDTLASLSNIKELDISDNEISDVNFLINMGQLVRLNLSNNKISNIETFKYLKKIVSIKLNNNKIESINQFNFLEELNYFLIFAHDNPCFEENDIKLNKDEGQYIAIKNELSKLRDEPKNFILPAKVLLLGNTKSGKSTLLDYILQEGSAKVLNKISDSTHVLKIEKLPKKSKKNTLPTAVFYDFGGQDYYHGLYNAFMSKKSINIILWNQTTNYNQIQSALDRNDEITRNFNVNYWLNQLRYFYTKENVHNSKKIVDETLFLLQTHADLNHSRQYYFGNSDDYNLKNEFYISLTQESIERSKSIKASLDYFTSTLEEDIENKRQEVEKPKWYIDFLKYILNKKGRQYTSLSEIENHYKRKNNEDLKFLPIDLEQLSYSGLILFYKNDNDLKDVAWLDPSATLKHIYSKILKKDLIIKKKGIVEYDEFIKLVNDEKLIKMLSNQKVIFHDTFDNNIIIPGYLPLISTEEKLYQLMTFDFIEPSFVLKFEYFIPFGLINQLICLYGKNNSKKYFWRDQLLFTKDNKHKILIKLDFCNLEILVSIKSNENDADLNLLKQELFSDILNLYWDEKPLAEKMERDHNEVLDVNDINDINIDSLIDGKLKAEVTHNDNLFAYRSPDDMYLSIDNKTFIHHKTLEKLEEKTTRLIAYECLVDKETRSIDKTKVKEQSAGLYKLYTTNKNIQTMKKIFISYSRKDFEYKEELKKHLNMLETFEIADNWSCEEISIGKWHDQIQKQLEESDLIIYMLSANFFSSKYILDKEVKVGMDLINKNKEKNILCVIVSEFVGLDKLKTALESRGKSELQEAVLNLSSYQYLPYDTIPNSVTNNNEEKIITLKEHTNRNTIERALTQITEKVLNEINK